MKYPNTKEITVVAKANTTEFLKAIKVELSKSNEKCLKSTAISPIETDELRLDIPMNTIAIIGTKTRMPNHTL